MEKGEEANLEVPGFYADFCDLLSYASAHGPGFRVDASSVEIVLEPSSFYDQLLVRNLEFFVSFSKKRSDSPCVMDV